MRPVIIILISITGLITSCYKVYDPQIDTTKKVLAVEGLITNLQQAYKIVLTWAGPFNSDEKPDMLNGANVYVTDNLGNSFKFSQKKGGVYMSDSLKFTSVPGRIYRLHIITPDGAEYESDPQKLFPESYPDTTYAEYGTEEILNKLTLQKISIHGAEIFVDIRNQSDTLPRYRFTSNLVMQYSYALYPRLIREGQTFCFNLYCWHTINANPDINLTAEKYYLNSAPVKKHAVAFLHDNVFIWAMLYGLNTNEKDTTATKTEQAFQYFYVEHHVLYLNLFTLNNETYNYYKLLEEQMKSDQKLFDPVPMQINGNIKCVSDPETKAIGFFEASSVSKSAYIILYHYMNYDQPLLRKTPCIVPPYSAGCMIHREGSPHQGHNIPPFWIFLKK